MASARSDATEERAERLRALLERDPEDATSWFGLGRALLDLERWDEAADAFAGALERDPRYTAAHRDLGRAHLAAGRAEAAEAVLRPALDLARDAGDLQTLREMETFLRRAERALGREPSAPAKPRRPKPAERAEPREEVPEARALYREGFEHFANDRHDEAIALFHRALELDPRLSIAWNGLSLAHRARGELDAAIEAGRKLIELEPDDALSHTNLSILYMRQGKIPEAEEEKAIAMRLQLAGGRS